MTAFRKISLVLAAALLALAAALLFLLPRRTALLRGLLEKRAAAALGMPVSIAGGPALSFSPGLGVALSGVRAGPPGAEAFKAERVAVRLALRPLLGREVRVLGAELDGASLKLAPEIKWGRGGSGAVSFALDSLKVRDGSLSYTGADGSSAAVSGLDLDASDLVYVGRPGGSPRRRLYLGGRASAASVLTGGAAAEGLRLEAASFSYEAPGPGGAPFAVVFKGTAAAASLVPGGAGAYGLELDGGTLEYSPASAARPRRVLAVSGGIKCAELRLPGGRQALGLAGAAGELSYEGPARGLAGGKLVFRGGLSADDLKLGPGVEAAEAGLAPGGEFSYAFGASPAYAGLTLKGAVTGGTLRAGRFSFSGLAMRADFSGGRFAADPVSMYLFGGSGRGRLEARLGKGAPRYEADFLISGTTLGALLDALNGGGEKASLRGPLELKVAGTAAGRGAAELKRSARGTVSLSGRGLVLRGLDLDDVVAKLERSQNFNLIDAGAFLLAGPLGTAVTKSYNFVDLGLARGRRTRVERLMSEWRLAGGHAETRDVALATDKYRLAIKGRVALAGLDFEEMTLAILDERGCAAYTQTLEGTAREPRLGKLSMLESLAGPVLSVLGTAEKLVPGSSCKPFYTGSVPPPAPERGGLLGL